MTSQSNWSPSPYQNRPSPLFTEPGYEAQETYRRPSAFGIAGPALESLEQISGPGIAYGQLRRLNTLMNRQVHPSEATMRSLTLVNPTLEKLVSASERFVHIHQARITCVTLVMDEYKRRMREQSDQVMSIAEAEMKSIDTEFLEPQERSKRFNRPTFETDLKWQLQQWFQDLYDCMSHLLEYLPHVTNLILRFDESHPKDVFDEQQPHVQSLLRHEQHYRRKWMPSIGEYYHGVFGKIFPKDIAEQMRVMNNWRGIHLWQSLHSLRLFDASYRAIYSPVLMVIWVAAHMECHALRHLQLGFDFSVEIIRATLQSGNLSGLQSVSLEMANPSWQSSDREIVTHAAIRYNYTGRNYRWPPFLKLLACNAYMRYKPEPLGVQTLILTSQQLSTIVLEPAIALPELRYLDLGMRTSELDLRTLHATLDRFRPLDFQSAVSLHDVQENTRQLAELLRTIDVHHIFWNATNEMVDEFRISWTRAELVRLDFTGSQPLWVAQVLSLALDDKNGMPKAVHDHMTWSALRHLELHLNGRTLRTTRNGVKHSVYIVTEQPILEVLMTDLSRGRAHILPSLESLSFRITGPVLEPVPVDQWPKVQALEQAPYGLLDAHYDGLSEAQSEAIAWQPMLVQVRNQTLHMLRVLNEALQAWQGINTAGQSLEQGLGQSPGQTSVRIYVEIQIEFVVDSENLEWQFDWISGMTNPVFNAYIRREHPEAFKSYCTDKG